MKLDGTIWRCDHYMIIFGLGIPAKHGRVGHWQAKPEFPHFADVHPLKSELLMTKKIRKLAAARAAESSKGWKGCTSSK
jgi:hypothetical protein